MEPDSAPWRVTSMRAATDDRIGDARELYVASYDRLVRLLTLASGSQAEAEDAVQEAFARLVPRWPEVATYDDPEAWVRKVAFRVASSRLRRARRQLAFSRNRRADVVPAPTSDRVDVVRALSELPEVHRRVLVLYYLCELSVAEVAAEIGVPVGTVKSRLARARTAVKSRLGEKLQHG